MPIREYTCTQGHTFERVERMDEKEEVRRCERCGRPALRVLSTPNIPIDGSYSYRETKRKV